MSYAVRFSPEARDQLDAIEDYIAIASGSPATAARFVERIVRHCESFETFPERGIRRDDLMAGLRITGYHKRVTIAFLVDTATEIVSIAGVFYGGRDYDSLLPGEGRREG